MTEGDEGNEGDAEVKVIALHQFCQGELLSVAIYTNLPMLTRELYTGNTTLSSCSSSMPRRCSKVRKVLLPTNLVMDWDFAA